MISSNTPEQKPPFAVFFATSIVMFVLTLSAADSIGFVPCQFDDTCSTASPSVTLADLPQLGLTDSSGTQTNQSVLPTRLVIPAIGLDLPVQNPQTSDIDALDALLNKGPARHPQTAALGEPGNMVIFGHSSHLAIAHPMFKAFNNLPDLKPGDSIEVDGTDGKQYLYAVDSVEKADATIDTQNFNANPSKKLYIITCDNFTGKSARFIMTAHFIGVVNPFNQ
ncbi:MAG TPA: sortase [Candidatus Paceibacterota bacterium]|nr:sortase [Candidatus Paceibacterota bacterium]